MTKIYAIAHDVAEWDVMPCPPQLLALANTKKRDATKAPANIELDQPQNIARAERLLLDYVARNHIAIQRSGGDDRTYAVCAEVLSLGLSPNKAFEVIDRVWNPHCKPRWGAEPLFEKIENAARYAQNEAGAWAVPPVRERIPSEALDKLLAESATQPSAPADTGSPNLFCTRRGFQEMPEPKWLLHKTIREDTDVALVGHSQHLKSEMAAHLSGSLIESGSFLNAIEVMKDAGPVFYGAGEDFQYLGDVRFSAWEMKYSKAKAPYSCDGFYVCDGVPLINDEESQQRFIADIKARLKPGERPSAVVIDTLVRTLNGNDENSSSTMDAYCNMVKRIRRETGARCTISCHHMPWGAKHPRGSGALYAGMDVVIYLTDLLKVPPHHYVKVTVDKAKQGRSGRSFYLDSVPIDTGKGEGFTLAYLDDLPKGAKAATEKNNAAGVSEDMYSKIFRCLLAKDFVRPKACDTNAMLMELCTQERTIDDSMDARQIKSAVERMRGAMRRAGEKDDRISRHLSFAPAEGKLRWGLTKELARMAYEPDADLDAPDADLDGVL